VSANEDIEQGLEFAPKFDANGLITAIAQDAETGQVLMKAQNERRGPRPNHQNRPGRLFQQNPAKNSGKKVSKAATSRRSSGF